MKLNLALAVITPQMLTFIGIYLYSKGKSGGDMGMVFFTTISLLFFIFLWGIISFKWDWRRKLTILHSLILCSLLEAGIMKLFL
jgi:hypothetical protein